MDTEHESSFVGLKLKKFSTLKSRKKEARRATTNAAFEPPTNIYKQAETEQNQLAEQLSHLSKEEIKQRLLTVDAPESVPEIQISNQAVERIGREERRVKSNSLSMTEHDPEKRDKMRFEVINEIVSTEKTYVKDLELLVQIFLQPLKSSKILQEGDIKAIFSNIEAILSVNQEINENLQKAVTQMPLSDMPVGAIFLKTIEFLKIYNVYSSNYENALHLYEKLTKENKHFVQFLKESQEKPECRGINLMGFLIKPVQKICKYPLLMKELCKNTIPSHEDFANIEKCYRKTQEIAEYVNEKKRVVENLQKMIEIKEKLVEVKNFTLITPGRTFIREGALGKVNNHGKLQERYFFLFSDVLVYTAHHMFKKTYQFKGAIKLNECLVSDLIGNEKYKFAFSLSRLDSKKKYIINFPSPEIKLQWMKDISDQIERMLMKDKEIEKTMSTLKLRKKTFRHSASSPFISINVPQETKDKYAEMRKKMLSSESDSVPNVILAVKTPDVTVSTRVTVNASVDSIISKLKLKVPGNTDNFNLYFEHQKLEPEKILKDYEYFANIASLNKNLETVDMEFKP